MGNTHEIHLQQALDPVPRTFSCHLFSGTCHLTVFTSLLEYSSCISKIYMKMANKHQIGQSVASFGKADEIFMMKSLFITRYSC